MIMVRVCAERTGWPIKNACVILKFDGVLPNTTDAAYTDVSGEASFECEVGRGKVFVNGQLAYGGQLGEWLLVYV
jgi:hypothetical protein